MGLPPVTMLLEAGRASRPAVGLDLAFQAPRQLRVVAQESQRPRPLCPAQRWVRPRWRSRPAAPKRRGPTAIPTGQPRRSGRHSAPVSEVSPSHLIVGSGSVDVLDVIAKAFLGPGHNAVISEHAFARFRQIVDARNRGARLVPMRHWTHDLEAMARAVDEQDAARLRRQPEQPHRNVESPGRGRRPSSTR